MDVEKLRDDVRTQKVETATAYSRMKSLQQELDLLKEREAAQKAAQRLKNMGGDSYSKSKLIDDTKERERERVYANKERRAADRARGSYLTSGDEGEEEEDGEGEESSSDYHASSESKINFIPDSVSGLVIEAKDKYPRSRPILSATPPRRPHYTLPVSRGHASVGEHPVSDVHRTQRNSYSGPSSIGFGTDSRSHSHNRSLTGTNTALDSDSSPYRNRPAQKQSSSIISRDSTGKVVDDKSNSSMRERKRNMQQPAPASASLHFSDSELLHYQQHSTSKKPQTQPQAQPRSSGSSLSRQHDNEYLDDYPPRPPQSHHSRFAHADDSTAVLGSSSKSKSNTMPPNIRISFDNGSGIGSLRDSANSIRGESLDKDKDISLMQRRAQILLERDPSTFRVSDPDPDPDPDLVPLSAAPTDTARYDRLQNMYERLTGKGAPTSWRDSDSSESD